MNQYNFNLFYVLVKYKTIGTKFLTRIKIIKRNTKTENIETN